MARGPVLSRKWYFDKVNRNSPVVRMLDYATVDLVEFGAAVETRPIANYADYGRFTDVDLVDFLPDSINFVVEQDIINNFQGVHSIQQTLRDFTL